jgi:hypothetical protein
MAWKCCISLNDTRHAIPPSYGESEERLGLTRISIDASQCNAGHLVKIWLLDFLCLMLESLSRSNPLLGSAISNSTPTSPLGSILTCLFRVGVKGIGWEDVNNAITTTVLLFTQQCLSMQGGLFQESQLLVDLYLVPRPQINLLSPFVEITRMMRTNPIVSLFLVTPKPSTECVVDSFEIRTT